MKRRHLVLAAALLATTAAAWWAGDGEEGLAHGVAVSAVVVERQAPAAPAPAQDWVLPESGRGLPAPGADPFAPRHWAPPAVERAAAPVAPPLPYAYFGRLQEGRDVLVFLQRGDRTYTARRGELLDPDYRIADITPDAVVIVYLPLKQRQTLHTGSESQ